MNLSPKYKILFLVAVFEKEDCVEDLIQNFHTIAPNSGILFHVNSNRSDEFYNKIVRLSEYYNFCHILPSRFPSDWSSGYLTHVFIESMRWAIENKIADYIYITHSNSLLINPNLEKNIYLYDIYFPSSGGKYGGDWWEFIILDSKIFDYVSNYNKTIYCASIEGSAMTLEIAQYFVHELSDYLPTKNVQYPSEEYYFPSAFMKAKEKYKNKWFDGALERWGHTLDHIATGYQLGVKENQEYIISLVLDEQFEVLTKLNLYSIKKIPREYYTPQRIALRNHFKYHNVIF